MICNTMHKKTLLEPNKLTVKSEQIKGEELVASSQYTIFTRLNPKCVVSTIVYRISGC